MVLVAEIISADVTVLITLIIQIRTTQRKQQRSVFIHVFVEFAVWCFEVMVHVDDGPVWRLWTLSHPVLSQSVLSASLQHIKLSFPPVFGCIMTPTPTCLGVLQDCVADIKLWLVLSFLNLNAPTNTITLFETLAPLLRTTLALNVKVTSDEAGLRRTAPSELHCINVWVSQRSHPDYARRQVPYTHVRWIMAQVSFLIMWQTGRAVRMKVESDSGSAAKCSGCFRATSAVWNADTSEAHTPCDGRLCWGRWAG